MSILNEQAQDILTEGKPVRVVKIRGDINAANKELESLHRHGYVVLSVSCERVLLEEFRRAYEGETIEEWCVACYLKDAV